MGVNLFDLGKELAQRQAETQSGVPREVMDIITASRLDLTKENPDPEAILLCNGLPFATRGNFSVIIGLPGSRKSFLMTMLAGAYLHGECGCFKSANGKGTILWIDTEQAPGHVARVGRRINRLDGRPENENAPEVVILMLREYAALQRKDVFRYSLEVFHPDLVILDGAADLMDDPNNIEQSAEIQQLLMAASKQYDCHISTVVHCNPGNDKARGHLGSNLMRKCETAVTVTAQGEVSKVSFVKTRDMRPNNFAFSVVNGLPAVCDVPAIPREDNTREMFAEILSDGRAVSHGDLSSRVMKYRENEGKPVKYDRAKQIVNNATKAGIIFKTQAGGYVLSNEQEGSDNQLPF